MLAKPVEKRTPADYDDLGASYDKLGQHQQAIDTILAKIERFPTQNRYESQANLGTFYIHNGQLELGLTHIDQAIAINPDAHFGREVYQKLLVQYMLSQRAASTELEGQDQSQETEQADLIDNFALYVLEQKGLTSRPFDDDGPTTEQIDAEISRAIKGVLGMMRFGNFESPVLLAALGDLLLHGYAEGRDQRLAARAYLKASYEADDPARAAAYREQAERALMTQAGADLTRLEAEFKREIAEGDAYFAQIEADELAWAEAGKDLDAEFAGKYYQSPVFEASLADKVRSVSWVTWLAALIALLFVMGGLSAGAAALLIRRRRLAASTA